MPYKSEKQRRYVKMKEAQGEPWAKSFAAHSDKGKTKGLPTKKGTPRGKRIRKA